MICPFILGFFTVAVIAAVVCVATRNQERRHRVGLAAAQAWAEGHAENASAEYFGEQVGLAYRKAVAAASTQEQS